MHTLTGNDAATLTLNDGQHPVDNPAAVVDAIAKLGPVLDGRVQAGSQDRPPSGTINPSRSS